ncbi:MAG: cytochrome c oxidase assembly protein [Novosphingobium sp.]
MSAAATVEGRNRKVGLLTLGAALAMLGLGYASVPLYRIFCEATGLNGTTRRASAEEAASVKLADGEVTVRFDANVERGMPWSFSPEAPRDKVRLGGRHMAFYLAVNNSDQPVTGRATFNVEPEQAARYFNKIQCFCFEEQTLKPHEQVRMPVLYFVDPAIRDDPDASDVTTITLSYTFHQNRNTAAKPLDRAQSGG